VLKRPIPHRRKSVRRGSNSAYKASPSLGEKGRPSSIHLRGPRFSILRLCSYRVTEKRGARKGKGGPRIGIKKDLLLEISAHAGPAVLRPAWKREGKTTVPGAWGTCSAEKIHLPHQSCLDYSPSDGGREKRGPRKREKMPSPPKKRISRLIPPEKRRPSTLFNLSTPRREVLQTPRWSPAEGGQ